MHQIPKLTQARVILLLIKNHDVGNVNIHKEENVLCIFPAYFRPHSGTLRILSNNYDLDLSVVH